MVVGESCNAAVRQLQACKMQSTTIKNKLILTIMEESNIIRTEIKISDLKQGMTVEKDGELFTVSNKDITFDQLFGHCFRGDGSKKFITRIQFKVPTAFGFRIE